MDLSNLNTGGDAPVVDFNKVAQYSTVIELKDEIDTSAFPSNIKDLAANGSKISVIESKKVESETAPDFLRGKQVIVFTLENSKVKYSLLAAQCADANNECIKPVGDKVIVNIDGMELHTKEGKYAFELK